jgi:tetratricopeptide (TPR) repeat protein
MKLTGEDIDIYHERANYYIEKKDYNAALVDCARAMELRNDPRQYFYTEGEGFKVAEMKEHAADYNLRARIYKHKGEYALAQLDYSKAIELRGMVLDYEERAEFYCERKDYDSAIADYKKVVELGGSINYYDSRLKEIDEYLSHKDNCECIEHWNKMKRDSNFCKPELYDPECLPF